MDQRSDEFEREEHIVEEDNQSDDARLTSIRDQQDRNQPLEQNDHLHDSNDRNNSAQGRNTRSSNRPYTSSYRQRSNQQNNRNNSRHQQQNTQLCQFKFQCGHQCRDRHRERNRQTYRQKHSEQYCPNCLRDLNYPCEKILGCGHQCQSIARVNPCPACEKEIDITLKCMHEIKIKCKNKNDEILCKNPCERQLQCSHICNLLCSEDCLMCICLEQVQKYFDCQHEQLVECYNQKAIQECQQICNKQLYCGHYCNALCKDKCPEDFHEFCEDDIFYESNHYVIPEYPFNNDFIINRYNQFYQTQIDINQDFISEREVEIELYIFQQLFKKEIIKMSVDQIYQNLKIKLIRFLERDDIYYLIDEQQFKLMKDLTLQFILQHYKKTSYEIDQVPNKYTEIQQIKLFNYYLGHMICKQKLKCEHICEQFFHLDECVCQIKNIIIIRQCGHYVITMCHNREYLFQNPCQEMKIIRFHNCQHQKQVPCYDYKQYQCEEQIQQKCRRCNNINQIKCYDQQNFICTQKLKVRQYNCDHFKEVSCQEDEQQTECYELIDHICSKCNDKQQILCLDKLNYQCQNKINITYQGCSHYQQVSCFEQDLFQKCNMKVTLCLHQQNIECYKRIENCKKLCGKLLQCQHKCKMACSAQCVCLERCEKQLRCGHNCQALCQDNCPQDFHDFCEENDCWDFNSDDSFEDDAINQEYLIQKYNNIYLSQIEINIELDREIDIELYIFKQLFKDEIEQMKVDTNYKNYQRKLIRYLQRDDIYNLIDQEQFKFMKDLTLKFIIQHYKQINYQMDQHNEYTDIQQYKMFNYYLGKLICKQKLICGHLCEQYFHLDECKCQIKDIIIIRQCGHRIITECHNREYKLLNQCTEICHKRLPCGHYCLKLCQQICKCEQIILIDQQGCYHKKIIKCDSQEYDESCYEMKTITFKNCSHTKEVQCCDRTQYLCEVQISNICSRCNNQTQIKCKDKNEFKCNKQIRIKFKNCDHLQEILCKDYKNNNQCLELIEHICRRCKDKQQILCLDKLNYECQNKINITYNKCSHYQLVSCYQYDQFVNCTIKVTLCQHQQNIECYKITNCQKVCGKLLQCNHKCKMACSEQCICNERIIFRLKCGHTKEILCNQQSKVVCEQICNKILQCKHLCMQKCTDNCVCAKKVDHIFSCGHKISIKCGEQSNLLVCQQSKLVTLPCNHNQIRYCNDYSIQKCQEICNKTLSCGDQCIQQCQDKCMCWFWINNYPCSHSIEGCSRIIPFDCQKQIWFKRECGHSVLKICSDPLTLCQEKCNKVLKCNHQCQDLCANKCQVKCNICLRKEEQKNFIYKSTQFINQQDLTKNQYNLNQKQTCNKCKYDEQECKCKSSSKSNNDLCINKMVKQCPSCNQEQIIIYGGQLQCKCNTVKSDKNQQRCKVILSCNHVCGGILCTSNFHELCSYQTICQHNQQIYCSGKSECQLCDPNSQQKNKNIYYFSNYTIQNLPSLKNAIYEKNRILFQKIASDDKLKYKIDDAQYKFLVLKLENLVAYIQQDKKIFLNINKYSKMEKIEKSNFYLTSIELQNL